MNYVKDRSQAESMLQEAARSNPGPWVDHSFNVAKAAERIAADLQRAGYPISPDIAYSCGILHDIGRYVGFTPSIIHSLDGYLYMIEKGYEGTANACVTHSFPAVELKAIVGWADIPENTRIQLLEILKSIEWTMYDKVITVCDALADAEGFSTIEKRIVSAAMRNGVNENSPTLWKGYYTIKEEIEGIIQKSIYELLPGVEESIYTEIAVSN